MILIVSCPNYPKKYLSKIYLFLFIYHDHTQQKDSFSQDSPISAQTLNSIFLDCGWKISITTAIAQTDLL